MAVVLKIVHEDQDQEQEIRVVDTLTIGRGSKADVRIKDEALSSLHGKFKLESNGKLLYEDLDSKNGSQLNGVAVYASHFMIDDSLKVGNAEIRLDPHSLSTSERYDIGKRYTKGRRQKDITLIKDES